MDSSPTTESTTTPTPSGPPEIIPSGTGPSKETPVPSKETPVPSKETPVPSKETPVLSKEAPALIKAKQYPVPKEVEDRVVSLVSGLNDNASVPKNCKNFPRSMILRPSLAKLLTSLLLHIQK